jgi:hypothetical protein
MSPKFATFLGCDAAALLNIDGLLTCCPTICFSLYISSTYLFFFISFYRHGCSFMFFLFLFLFSSYSLDCPIMEIYNSSIYFSYFLPFHIIYALFEFVLFVIRVIKLCYVSSYDLSMTWYIFPRCTYGLYHYFSMFLGSYLFRGINLFM